MRAFYCFSIFAALYILLILLLQASAQQSSFPPGIGGGNPNRNDGSVSSTDNSNSGSNSNSNNSTGESALSRLQQMLPTSLSLDKLGITDPYVRQTLTNVYGTLLGRPECVKKSMCIMGNYLHDLPARDIVFTLLGRYVPPEWGLLYDIFRVSVMYGQNCEVYFCSSQDVQSVPVSSASPYGAVSNDNSNQNQQGQGASNLSPPLMQMQMQQNKPQHNYDFDNQIHKIQNR